MGLIHRDIKPANVWLEKRKDGHERVRLLDFGLAQMETGEPSLTQPGSIMGTPQYMAPEQARGEPIDGRTDLFSVGAMMYELLTGNRAFSGKTPTSVLSSILADTPAAPASIEATCPPCLSDLTQRLLEKEPAKRVANATELQAALAECRRAIERSSSSTTDNDAARAVTLAETVQFAHSTHPSLTPVRTEAPLTDRTEPDPVASTSHSTQRQRPVWLWPLMAGLGLIALIFTALLLFQTPTGTLVVEISDDAKLLFEKGELHLLNEAGAVAYRLTVREPADRIRSGKYQVQVVGADGLMVSTESFEIERNEKQVIRVTARPNTDGPTNAGPTNAGPTNAGPTSTGPTSTGKQPATVPGYPSFRGKPIFVTDFEDPSQWPIPLIDNATTLSQINNGVLVYRQLKHDPGNPYLSIPLVARLNRGAFAIRCKNDTGTFFFNFCVHNSGTQSRDLSFSVKDGGWVLYVQRHDMEDNQWKILKPVRVDSSSDIQPGLGKDAWTDIAFHWSEKYYDIWLDGKHIAGGTLPTDELVNGRPQPVYLGMRTSPALLPQIEIDYIGLWDQTDVSLDDAREYRTSDKAENSSQSR